MPKGIQIEEFEDLIEEGKDRWYITYREINDAALRALIAAVAVGQFPMAADTDFVESVRQCVSHIPFSGV